MRFKLTPTPHKHLGRPVAAELLLLFAASHGMGGQPIPALPVHVYNYAGIPDSQLRRAEETALSILQRAGVQLELVRCPITAVEAVPAGCTTPGHEGFIQLRVMSGKGFGAAAETGGISVLGQNGRFGTVANVSVDRASAVAADVGGGSSVLLGGFIAHELGHLLLNSSKHECDGIMHSPWTRAELIRLEHGVLQFTRDEQIRLRRQIQARLSVNERDGQRLTQLDSR